MDVTDFVNFFVGGIRWMCDPPSITFDFVFH